MTRSNESSGLEKREARWPTLRGALLGAVAGAALFLGVGAALPLWPAEGSITIHPVEPTSRFEERKAPLWDGGRSRRVVIKSGTDLALGILGLLIGGAVAGLVTYAACFSVRRRKGGEV